MSKKIKEPIFSKKTHDEFINEITAILDEHQLARTSYFPKVKALRLKSGRDVCKIFKYENLSFELISKIDAHFKKKGWKRISKKFMPPEYTDFDNPINSLASGYWFLFPKTSVKDYAEKTYNTGLLQINKENKTVMMELPYKTRENEIIIKRYEGNIFHKLMEKTDMIHIVLERIDNRNYQDVSYILFTLYNTDAHVDFIKALVLTTCCGEGIVRIPTVHQMILLPCDIKNDNPFNNNIIAEKMLQSLHFNEKCTYYRIELDDQAEALELFSSITKGEDKSTSCDKSTSSTEEKENITNGGYNV